MAKVHESGLRGNSFSWELRNSNGTLYRGGARPNPRLCPQLQFGSRIFNKKFDKFLAGILSQPNVPAEYLIDTPEIYVRVKYKSGQEFSTGNYPAFEYPHSLTENRIYGALKEKAIQLKKAGSDVPMGVLLCDGGTNLLQARKSWQSYSIEEILAQFFTDYPDITFVAIFSVLHDRKSPLGSSDYLVRVDLHGNPKHNAFVESIVPLFDLLRQHLPSPRHTPTNARLRLEEGEPKYKFPYFGGMTMKGRSIRMSARTLLELLGGKIRVEDLDFKPVNPFLHKLQNGRLITAINFHSLEDKDDDEVTIEFGEPDPILTEFRKPARTVPKK
jgi:hypothetical protein